MAVKWTDEQINAIEETSVGVVVPAAAGSGKTAVLIERTVRLLEDKDKGCPAERLLAVTFTKDAASQMKNKLRAALMKRLSEETDPAKKAWLERQYEMLALANISTINSFCLDLLKSNLNELEYRSGIKIADDNQVVVLLDEAMERALDEMREETPERVELLIDALTKNSDKELAAQARDLYDYLRSLAFPEEWLENTKAMFEDREKIDELVSEYCGELIGDMDEMFAMQQQCAETAAELNKVGKVMEVMGDDLELLEEMKAALMSGSWEQVFKASQSVSGSFSKLTKPSAKGLGDEEAAADAETFEKVKLMRNSMKDRLKAVCGEIGALGSDVYEPMRDAGYIFSALAELAQRLGKICGEMKLERGLAEFGDVERKTMELLVEKKDGRAVRKELAETLRADGAYKVILIDEFQDVNNLQEMIFRALSDSDDLGTLGRNIFVVGDVKQSIYRFRLSNPKLFMNAVEAARDVNNTGLAEIRLTKNFRSRKNIISFVNMMFRRLMSRGLGELDYDEREELRYGADYGGEDMPCEMMLIEDEEGSDELKYVIFGSEELAIARRIRSLLNAGAEVWEDGRPRKSMPSDYCVLAKGHKACRRIAAALEYVGLKARSEQTDGYMGSREIMTMVSLLKVIDDPMKDMPMAAVMLSSVMSFTADELARLRLLCRDGQGNNVRRLYQVIAACSKSEDADIKEADRIDLGDSELEAKCLRAYELLGKLRFYAVSMTLSQLVTKIYDETGFFAVASVFENSKQKRANLRLLTQRAAEYEKDQLGGIAGFLRYLEHVTAAGGDFTQALTTTSGPGSVAVMTFHGSKGLEFPFVFLTGLGTGFNLSDRRDRVLVNEQFGAGIKYMRHDKLMNVNTIAHKRLERITVSELLSEELRLLYVAMTRAKERLFIPFYMKAGQRSTFDRWRTLAGRISAAGGLNARLLTGCSCSGDWIAAAMMVSRYNRPLMKRLELEDMADELAGFYTDSGELPKIEWRRYPEQSETGGERIVYQRPAADPGSVDALLEKYSYHVPNDVGYAAAKRTVTEIVTEMSLRTEGDNDPMFFPQLGSLKEEADRLTGSERGTFTHLFMELADYERAEMNVKDEIERLAREGFISRREADGIYADAVQRFFESELYKRMKKSDSIERERKFMVRSSDAGLDKKFAPYLDESGMLQGVCDCIFKEDDGYVLVDYKTDAFRSIEDLDKYSVQLELYKAALDMILPMPVKSCCIYSFKLSAVKELKVSE